jgi:hypothetical protein
MLTVDRQTPRFATHHCPLREVTRDRGRETGGCGYDNRNIVYPFGYHGHDGVLGGKSGPSMHIFALFC